MKKIGIAAPLLVSIPAFHLLMLPLWLYSSNSTENSLSTTITLIELFVDLFGGMTILLVMFFRSWRKTASTMAIFSLLVLIASAIGIILHFINWAITVGSFVAPDAETKLIFESALAINTGLVVFLSIVTEVLLRVHARK